MRLYIHCQCAIPNANEHDNGRMPTVKNMSVLDSTLFTITLMLQMKKKEIFIAHVAGF